MESRRWTDATPAHGPQSVLPPRGAAGGQRPDEGGHPPLHAPRSSPDEAFREGEAPSEPVRWACAVRTPRRWAASAVETPRRLSRPPRNTASPSGPSAPQTTLNATAETAACGVPLTVAFGNEGLPGGCCDRVRVTWRLIGQFPHVTLNRGGKTCCGIWCGFINKKSGPQCSPSNTWSAVSTTTLQ